MARIFIDTGYFFVEVVFIGNFGLVVAIAFTVVGILEKFLRVRRHIF